ncbi:hypothetical protein B0A48_18360 [Cryoendolithus antarcticus]|uniref:Nucleoside phosphorylase domain-containing protein n=1 Tax=Cryoendolithus antarcticus TaxID=1507870 RepID=A0A1V8SA74_9PEZI|nr:hypothetical protein B0A48_18360 [Cryoendolithus antarcticus]
MSSGFALQQPQSASTSNGPPPSNRKAFRIAVKCALPEERDIVEHLMNRFYEDEGKIYGKVPGDDNHYTIGDFGGKPIVLVAPPQMGTVTTRQMATHMCMSFPNIAWALVVGISGAAPFEYHDGSWRDSGIQLGDVMISTQVVSDFGTQLENRRKRKTNLEDTLSQAPPEITNLLNMLKTGKNRVSRRVLGKTQANFAELASPNAADP